jgi:hypothetical protein
MSTFLYLSTGLHTEEETVKTAELLKYIYGLIKGARIKAKYY